MLTFFAYMCYNMRVDCHIQNYHDQRNIVVEQQVAAPTVRIDCPTQRVVIQAHQHMQIQATIDGSKALRSSKIQGRSVTVHTKVHDIEYNFVLTLSEDGQRLVGHWSTTQTGLLTPITLDKVQKFR